MLPELLAVLSFIFHEIITVFNLQIEREKADLSVQVIQLSERLEEAEGGAESQVNIIIISIKYINSKLILVNR